jgi:hypothetical protein
MLSELDGEKFSVVSVVPELSVVSVLSSQFSQLLGDSVELVVAVVSDWVAVLLLLVAGVELWPEGRSMAKSQSRNR